MTRNIPEEKRRELLSDLVHLAVKPSQLQESIKELPWDSERPLMTVTCGDLVNVLTLYREGVIDPNELQLWGRLVELREDLEDDLRNPNLVKDIVFELAHPELARPLSQDRIEAMLYRLDKDCTSS